MKFDIKHLVNKMFNSLHKPSLLSTYSLDNDNDKTSRDCAVVRALAYHQRGPMSIPKPHVICELSLLFSCSEDLKTLCRPAYIASVCYCFDSVAKENRLKIKKI